jgi:DNA-binding transcriptional LysR family regulator
LSKRAIAAFDELKQGLRDLEYLANPTIGHIRIGCPDSLASTILPKMITGFCRDFPGIALRFDQVPTPTLDVPELHARKLDMVVAWLSVPEDQYGDNLNVEILLEDEVVVAAGRNSHWARRRRISLSDIVNGPWTGAPPETMARIVLDNAFRASNLPIPGSEVTTFSVPLRQHLLTLGGFLTAMPKSLLRRSPGLKALPILLPPHHYPIAIVTVKNRTLSPVVELFLERLRQFMMSSHSDPS